MQVERSRLKLRREYGAQKRDMDWRSSTIGGS